MRKTFFSLVLAGVLAFAAASAVAGAVGDEDLAVVKIPFTFIVNGKAMPAGSYRISTTGIDAATVLIGRTDGNGARALAVTERVPNSYRTNAETRVSFKMRAGQHFLWQILTPGGESRQVRLENAEMDRVLARLNLLPPVWVTGGARQ